MMRIRISQETVDSLREVAADDPTFLMDLVALYRRQHERKVLEIREAAGKGDLPRLAALLHMIKSSSGNLGAIDFHDFCSELEELAMSGNRAEIGRQLPDFLSSYDAVTAEIIRLYSSDKKIA